MTYILRLIGGIEYEIDERQKISIDSATDRGIKRIELEGDSFAVHNIASIIKKDKHLRLEGKAICEKCGEEYVIAYPHSCNVKALGTGADLDAVEYQKARAKLAEVRESLLKRGFDIKEQ